MRILLTLFFALLAGSTCARAEEEGDPVARPSWEDLLAEEQARLRELRDTVADTGGEGLRSWGDTLILARDRAAEESLKEAQSAIGAADWRLAAAILQKLCDRKDAPLAADPDPEKDPRVVPSARSLAQRMIREGPEPLVQVYASQNEAAARKLFQEAVKRRDAGRLREVARRYEAAPAGQAARAALVKIALSEGDFATAARELSEAAAGTGLAGIMDEAAWTAFLEEAARAGNLPWLRWIRGERERSEADGEGTQGAGAWKKRAEEIEKRILREAAESIPQRPVLSVETLWEGRFEEISPARRDPLFEQELMLPAPMLPCLAGERLLLSDGCRLTVFDRATGKLLAQSLPAPASYGIGYGPQVLHGTACDGARAWGNLPDVRPSFDSRIAAMVSLPTQDLFCWDLKNAKVLWRAKEAAARAGAPFSEEFSFPAIPLVSGGVVYAPAMTFKGLFASHIAAFSAVDGKPLWRTFLCSGQQEMNYFGRPIRESVASTPVLDAGRLFVSTNLGVVAALDPEKGAPLWLFQYDQIPQENQETRMYNIEPRLSDWKALPPAVVGPRLVVAPTDSRYLYVLDAATGRMLWRYEGRRASFFLADPLTETLCVVGRDDAVGLALADGRVRWRSVLRARCVHPGSASAGRFYFLADGRLTGLDAATGRIVCLAEDLPCVGPVAVEGRGGVVLSFRSAAAWKMVEAVEELAK